jgi:hexosaminidase
MAPHYRERSRDRSLPHYAARMPPVLLLLLGRGAVIFAAAQMPAWDDVPRFWPQPVSVGGLGPANATSLCVDKDSFRFEVTAGASGGKGRLGSLGSGGIVATGGDVLQYNIDYYRTQIFARQEQKQERGEGGGNCKPLAALLITVKQPAPSATDFPYLGMDESYALDIDPNVTPGAAAILIANTTWGAVRGLETFSQLFQMNRGGVTIRGGGASKLTVVDAPRFPWRGLMMDPARHYIPVADFNRTIDAMAQNKLNTLHLHLTDGESFSVNTESWRNYTQLSIKGAFTASLSYTPDDLAAIVAHGRLRGVRVVPEFDLPAHCASWAQGVPAIITDCPKYNPHPEWPRYYSPADPSSEVLYDVIDTVLAELTSVFPDDYWHVGGDEPHYECWNGSAKVTAFKRKHGGMTNQELYAYFVNKYAALVYQHGKRRIGWEEIFTIGGTPAVPAEDTSTVVHVWTNNMFLKDVVAAGLHGIVSHKWYLNNGGDWTSYYADDPLSYLPKNATAASKKLVLGGEACMWASAFDMSSNMESAIWPNAAAMAEQLWSGAVQSADEARTRLSQQRCRMVRRGVRAAPIAEDYCGDSVYVRKSRSFAYPGDFPVDPETPGP